MKEKEKLERIAVHRENYKAKLATFYKWKSEVVPIPRNMEILLRDNGSIGYSLKHHKWVIGSFTGIVDENNEFTTYICKTLSTMPETFELENHKEVIVCGNNCFYTPDTRNINWMATMDAENDISMYYQLVNSRNIPIIAADNDKVKKQIEKVFDNILAGRPAVITTDLLSEIQTIDVLDHDAISKMECLTALHDDLLKRNMNLVGASLDTKDKKAQVNNIEMQGFDDYTTLGFLANYESRLSFCDEMKENGIIIDVIRNPIFSDEPTEEEIESGIIEKEEETDGEAVKGNSENSETE